MARTTVNWSPQARSDVGNIYANLFDSSIKYADDWYAEVEDKINMIESFPEIGRIVPEKQLNFYGK